MSLPVSWEVPTPPRPRLHCHTGRSLQNVLSLVPDQHISIYCWEVLPTSVLHVLTKSHHLPPSLSPSCMLCMWHVPSCQSPNLGLPFSLALRPSLQLLVSWFCSPFCTPLSFLGAGPYSLLEWPLNHPRSSAALHQPILDTSVRSPVENTI